MNVQKEALERAKKKYDDIVERNLKLYGPPTGDLKRILEEFDRSARNIIGED